MKKFIYQLEQYVRETLGISVTVQPWEKSTGLPQYLREHYRFYKMDVLGTECVVMAATGEKEQAPGVIGKHLDQVRSRGEFEAVYARHAVISYNRKRLIDQKIPFIVPGNQLYLPILGIDLREHLKRSREKKPVFSPATQALILHVLWRKATGTITPSEIAHHLGYSPMSMTRAFDELETADIGEHSVVGKKRHLLFSETGRPLWEKALPYLNTPVKRRLYVASSLEINGNLAGQSALARYTMLAEPKVPVFAFSADEWRLRMQSKKIAELVLPEAGAFEIELWKYSPARFAHGGKVDRLSLYLSLKDDIDERVQSALDTLLGGMEW